MSLTQQILNNRHTVWALMIGAFLFGAVAYVSIPFRLFPDTAPPVVNVVTPWPGAGASEVADDLSRVLEEEMASLEGVAKVSTTSQDNLSRIQVEFQYGTEVELAAVDVQNAIASLGDDLPEGAEQPRVMTFSTADRPIYTVGVTSKDLLEARRLAEDVIGPRLQRVNGVAAVDVFGGQIPTVIVDVDPKLAEAYRLPLPIVTQAVRSSNLSVPAGRLRGRTTETMLRVDQRADRMSDLERVPLPMPDGSTLQLSDVATVDRGALEDDAWFSINGERAIAVQVFRTEDANTVSTVASVREVVKELAQLYPSVTFIEGEESASFTAQSVSNLLSNVWQALALASLILFLFLGRVRAGLITMLTMPLSYAITFGVMQAAGMEFNMVTLSAIILAVGMVVDASVVVLENIMRLRDEEGLAPVEAAVRGTDEVRMPVLAGVATTLVVLVPLLSLHGFIGKVFGPLALTLLIAFGSSVVVALVAVPVLSLYATRGGWLDDLGHKIAQPFQRAMDRLRSAYLWLLKGGLRYASVVVILAGVSFVVGLVGLVSAGMNVLPRMDSGAFSISLQTPSGSSLQETTAVVRAVEEIVATEPEVVLIQSQAGYEPGMLFTGGAGVMGPTQGFLSVTLTPRTERSPSIWEIEERLRGRLAYVPGVAHMTIKEVGNTAKPTTAAPVLGRISGPDPRVLDALGHQVEERLATIDGALSPSRVWHRDLERILVRVDPLKAAAMGQSVLSVAQATTMGAEGLEAGDFTVEQGSPEPIRVRYARSKDPQVEDMLSWPLYLGKSGQVAPVRSVAHAERVVEQGLFTREDLIHTLDIHAQLGDRPLSFVIADAQASLAELELPEGYTITLEGENNDLIAARSEILRAFAISIVAVYLLLVAQFRSFLHPITVMMAVPLSLSGVSLALFLAGEPISMPVMVGLVLLVGTVVNNSIILVDVIRQLRAGGSSRHDAIVEGVRTRFRPILMTSLSTIVGMIPLSLGWALGAERFSPLATAVIGGLLASTLLTLVVIPVLYDLADRLVLRLQPKPAQLVTPALLLLAVALAAPLQAQAQPVSLDEAWTLAERNHPSLTAADAQRRAAQATTTAAATRMLPTVDLTARYTKLSDVEPPLIQIPLTLPTGETPDPIPFGQKIEEMTVLRAQVTQPLFAGGALHNGRLAAARGADKAEAELAATEANLRLRVAEAWYGRVLALQAVQTQSQVVTAAKAQETKLQHLLDQGRATELMVAQVALQRAEAEDGVRQAEDQAELAALALTSLLGEPHEVAQTDLVAAARQIHQVPTGSSPAVAAAEAGAAAAKAKARAQLGLLSPKVALMAGYDYANPNTRYFPLRNDWNDSWDASVILTWTIDSGTKFAASRAARAQAQAARAQVEAVRTEHTLKESQAHTELRQAQEAMVTAQERVDLATRARDATRSAVEADRATEEELVQREADLARAITAQQRSAFHVLLASERTRALYYGSW